MGINLDSAEEKSFREAFPLGTGGLSKGKAEKTAGRLSESALGRSQKYTKAMKDKESAERRLSTLQKAKKEVKGTGKTQKQLAGERKKKAGSASTMKWTQTRETGIYGSTTVRKSGNITIRSTGGTHFIYKNGKQIGMSSKLSEAKALAERVK